MRYLVARPTKLYRNISKKGQFSSDFPEKLKEELAIQTENDCVAEGGNAILGSPVVDDPVKTEGIEDISSDIDRVLERATCDSSTSNLSIDQLSLGSKSLDELQEQELQIQRSISELKVELEQIRLEQVIASLKKEIDEVGNKSPTAPRTFDESQTEMQQQGLTGVAKSTMQEVSLPVSRCEPEDNVPNSKSIGVARSSRRLFGRRKKSKCIPEVPTSRAPADSRNEKRGDSVFHGNVPIVEVKGRTFYTEKVDTSKLQWERPEWAKKCNAPDPTNQVVPIKKSHMTSLTKTNSMKKAGLTKRRMKTPSKIHDSKE